MNLGKPEFRNEDIWFHGYLRSDGDGAILSAGPPVSTEDREMVTGTLTSQKSTVDEALDPAAQGSQMLS